MYLPLPKAKGPDEPRVILLRSGAYDPDINPVDIFKSNMMIQDILFEEDDQFIIAGQSMVQDMKGITINHMVHMTPSMVKKAMTCFHTAYPSRPKSAHFINIPSFFETIHMLFRPFLTEKLKQRVRNLSII